MDRVLPRLVVFETPSSAELKIKLGEVFPDVHIDLRPRPALDGHDLGLDALSTWHIAGDSDQVERQAPDLLRDLIYPLATRRDPFVVSFEAGRSVFQPRSLTTNELGELDIEDLLKLLGPDSAGIQDFDRLHLFDSHLPQTPIEDRLGAALQEEGIEARPQVRLGPFVVDFLVEAGGNQWAIEADGQAYHDPDRDAERDMALADLGVEQVLRFTGSKIHRNPGACARRVNEVIAGTKPNHRIKTQDLDHDQKLAARHASGPARVLAPAGAGKTRVLVERIAELIRSGAEPSSILALAFNKKANDQLVSRLEEIGVRASPTLFDGSIDGVRCATFHAFGLRFQREYLKLSFDIEDSSLEWRKLMERALENCEVRLEGTKRGSDPIGEFLRARERASADLVNPDEIEVELDYFDEDDAQHINFGAINSEFERLRVDRQVLSFSDMLTSAVQQLLGSPSAREFVQEYFTHVLVDEYQDLNASQLAIVDLVSRPSRDLFVVGDDVTGPHLSVHPG